MSIVRPHSGFRVKPLPRSGTARHPPSLRRHIEARLGTGAGTQARNFLAKPLGANSLASFWRHWNPVYGYVLFCFSRGPQRVTQRA